MSWIRVGDEFNSAPEWGKAFELALDRNDTRLVNELKGATQALYTASAQQWTDYVLRYGEAALALGHENTPRLLADLERIGVIVEADHENRVFTLLERENFIHLIKSDEKKRNAKRKRDRNRGSLQVPVLLRDGDQCRYCAVEVSWADTRGDTARQLDHRNIDEETTPDNYVVCCKECNKLRHDLGEEADTELPLLDPPEVPIYGSELIRTLARWPRIVEKMCRQLGLRNPLLGDVETHESTPQPVGDTTFDTVYSSTSTPSQTPAGNQPAGERLPRDSRKVAARGRAKGTQPPHHTRQGNNDHPTRRSQGQSDNQSGRAPQNDHPSNAQDGRSAKGIDNPDVRKRRRRNRRR